MTLVSVSTSLGIIDVVLKYEGEEGGTKVQVMHIFTLIVGQRAQTYSSSTDSSAMHRPDRVFS